MKISIPIDKRRVDSHEGDRDRQNHKKHLSICFCRKKTFKSFSENRKRQNQRYQCKADQGCAALHNVQWQPKFWMICRVSQQLQLIQQIAFEKRNSQEESKERSNE